MLWTSIFISKASWQLIKAFPDNSPLSKAVSSKGLTTQSANLFLDICNFSKANCISEANCATFPRISEIITATDFISFWFCFIFGGQAVFPCKFWQGLGSCFVEVPAHLILHQPLSPVILCLYSKIE